MSRMGPGPHSPTRLVRHRHAFALRPALSFLDARAEAATRFLLIALHLVRGAEDEPRFRVGRIELHRLLAMLDRVGDLSLIEERLRLALLFERGFRIDFRRLGART